MKDIRLLTLYKQHYLDQYDSVLNSQITCLGYYDGLDLKKIDEVQINNKNSSINIAPITNLWYSTGRKVEGLPGGYSNQNIGLIRCVVSKDQVNYTRRYWQIEDKLPFFSVAFLKLRNFEKYDEIGQMIENSFFKDNIAANEESCIILSYSTFDNSDLILLLKGNDIIKIEETLNQIESMPEIMYLHSILGIEEKYLKCCSDNENILEEWQGIKCFVEKKIQRIEMQLATCGGKHILAEIKKGFKKWNQGNWKITGLENMIYSYVMGHGNINLMLKETDVRSLLILLLPGGFSTHQNQAYKHGIYNIETNIFIKEHLLSYVTDIEASNEIEQTGQSGWCKQRIEKYREYFNNELIKKDECLYSYYQALIQTLNALDQYERFALSRDIFDIIFPSFRMFDGKIKRAFEKMQTEGRVESIELLKEAMKQYLECVNSVVYHTIHTEQVYLMIPGYSGTSFSIPIKLKLFYAWYTYKIVELLNDAQKKHSCIIAPIIETRPMTSMIGAKVENDEKIIHICLSQRTLFQPKYLMIILAHEMGHYVGRDIRLRENRIKYLLKTMAYYITEAIFPEEYMGNLLPLCKSGIFAKMKKHIKENLQIKIITIFKEKKKDAFPDKKYYVKDMWEPLMQWCAEIFLEEGIGKEISDIIHDIPEKILSEIEQDSENYVENMRYISTIQKYLEHNRKRISNTGIMLEIVKTLMVIYQEIFSDITAIAILDCNRDDYRKAFYISEGNNINFTEGNKQIEQEVRERIMDVVVFHHETSSKGPWQNGTILASELETDSMCYEDRYLYANLPQFYWVIKSLEDYASECYGKIKERLADNNLSLVEEIRQVYKLLGNTDSDYDQIVAKISECIAEYKKMVKKEYRRVIV